jgi:NitT/TauT family transport system substrate-binding protein
MSNSRHPERTALTDNQGLARFFLSGNSFGCSVGVVTPQSLLILWLYKTHSVSFAMPHERKTMLRKYLVTVLVLATVAAFGKSGCAQDKILMSYGGFNETAGPLWVGMEKGFFKKYGLDVSALQVRNGQVSLSALMSGDVQAFWPAISSVLSGVSGGAKIGCVASPFNKIARELVVRKEIDSFAALREKVFGVQSIGGGFWLQTMIVLDRLGVEPEKNKLQMRVIGDEPTILQALLASNIDAAVMTFASASVAKRAGLRSLANTADLKVPYQGVGICTRSDRIVNSPDVILRLTKAMIETVAFSQDPRHKREVMAVLKKNLRLSSDEDTEKSYNSLRMVSTLDVAPDPEAWKNIQRLVSRVTPKVAQLDINQIVNGSFVKTLEENGFLPEARKKIGL